MLTNSVLYQMTLKIGNKNKKKLMNKSSILKLEKTFVEVFQVAKNKNVKLLKIYKKRRKGKEMTDFEVERFSSC